ncbi:Lrp/AsnC family transcriptional regulator [Arenibaculum pallidiluteum]|uniref:Lrp/AsnC family transcriptional regulator n=1 Tax=Arenibaculum pallidiluteum TaxID=2812559 RepID=UPI001A95DE28|nr:Lrp/AsnC family transcriptional regulator [Arenibaculum pallidiluteum]
MDEADRKIIAFVQANGRAGYAEIAAAAGLSVSAANERLRKLQDRGVIQGWGARVSAPSLGLGVLAFVHVLIDRPEHNEAFLARACAVPEVLEVHHVTGAWSYLLKIRARGIPDLERLLSEVLKTVPGVLRTETVIVLSSPKESAVLPEE